MTNIVVTCNCGTEFNFIDRDQVYYQQQGFYPPRRCYPCRMKKKIEDGAMKQTENQVVIDEELLNQKLNEIL